MRTHGIKIEGMGGIQPQVQIFGIKGSQASRAAERFFKERRIATQVIDLNRKPMAPAEIRRFVERFGLSQLIDTESKHYAEEGLKYLKISDTELLAKIEREPKLMKLPLVRRGKLVSIGADEACWRAMAEQTSDMR